MLPLVLALLGFGVAQEYTADSYPNPKSDFKKCGMRSVSFICDPDEVLTESERYRLNTELVKFAERTEGGGNTYCQRKGIDATLAIAQETDQKLADNLNHNWNAKDQCQKSVVFTLSSGSRKLYYSASQNTGIDPVEFFAIVSGQHIPLAEGHFVKAVSNILKQIGDGQNGRYEVTTTPPPPTRGRRPNSTATPIFTFLIAAVISRYLMA